MNKKSSLWCPANIFVGMVAVLTCFATRVQAVNLVQEFYLPMPESQLRSACLAVESGTGTNMFAIYSIVVSGNGTVIHYDQWEDGYEVNLASPAQSTTLIWGDGINSNGIAPGFTNDPVGLASGTVITLTNSVSLPRNPSQLLYDGRDRIAANKALVISRAGWPLPVGSVFGGSVVVPSTIDYDTNYVSPVGQDMTNNLFQYVGEFIMAAQNGTSVTIDTDGPGATAPFTISLNQGESYLVNGGLKKGGTIISTKPVQVNLVAGHINAHYAMDWFTLYPQNQWSDTYYTPVGSASSQPTYIYFYNPSASAITINYTNRSGSGSFSVPATNTFQYQMPQNSGASFTSVGGAKYTALCTVAANPSSDTAYNWGFTLLPEDGLTTEAVVGWGPGSSDGTQNGSPVWVTPLAATRVYVDYNGDRAGPLTDPNGNKYDTNYDVVALQSKTIYDPSKNQTGMRLYTIDGTLISAAWGEDPTVASPGNPYIDAGTPVLPFPVPTLKKTSVIVNDVGAPGLSVGDTLQYMVAIDNKSLLPLGNTVVIDAPSTNQTYVAGSTLLNGVVVPDSVSGTAFPLDAPGYTIPIILRGGTSTFQYQSVVNASGIVSNSVNLGGFNISVQNVIPAGTNSCDLNFASTNGISVASYAANANLFVQLTDPGANTASGTIQTVILVVNNTTRGDVETITLTETGANTGVFFNAGGLPSSVSTGLVQQDGILNAAPGDLLSVSWNNLVYGNSCAANAVIQTSTQNKVLYLDADSAGNPQLNRVDPAALPVQSIATNTPDFGASAALALDSVTTVSNNTTASATFSHTTSAAANRLLLVGISMNRVNATTAEHCTNVTYNGTALTLVGVKTNAASTETIMYLWALTNPAPGTFNVVVSLDKADTEGFIAGAATFTGVNQTTPYGAFFANTGISTGASNIVTSAAGELVFDTVAIRSADFGASGSPGAGQTTLWKQFFNARISGGASTRPGGGTVTNTWTAASSVEWAIGSISIKPAGTVTNFSLTQAPVFASNFSLPASGVVLVTNFVTVTSGSLPVNPNLTAILSYGTNPFITLVNPVYNSGGSNLVWTGILSSNVTIPVGQAITCTINSAQAGVTFHLDYGSSTKPSKIILPTTTVISVNSLGVYDAPYPGGSLVSAPASGQLLYVRTVVSDPFGSYDITSLNLGIDGPGTSADLNVALTNTVATNALTKTYEYAWQTMATVGNYTLSGTANEGTEGITNTLATRVTLNFLDTGTPSTTTFTSGSNGSATNAFAGNQSICVRVVDLDQNLNSAATETVPVTVTSSTGDSELVILTETTTNSGIFVNCLNSSTTTNDVGSLYASAGSVISVSYVDPTDATDTSSATATIQVPPNTPGVKMTKTLVSPANGQAGVGATVQFNLQVVNTGNTVLTNLAIVDNFPSAALAYQSASLTPNIISASSLSWTNLGAFPAGQVTNILVSFTATNASALATNFATAAAIGGATNTGNASLTITRAGMTITKTVLSPTNTSILNFGSNVIFRIVVKNTGQTAITSLPLEDTYSASQFQYISATNAPDGVGSGDLLWNDITGAGSLATNATITIDVLMKVVGAGSPAINTASADYAVDSGGNAVPSASGSVNVTNASAKITGHVYNDLDQSGTLTTNDVGLEAVNLALYTDPNGDGNIADGALVQLTTTDAGGNYELQNLSLGNYVIVETPLPGFANGTPATTQIPLVFTTLTTNANNNFFNYQPAVTNYASIGGTVWNDTNATGVYVPGYVGIPNVPIYLIQDLNTNGLVDGGEPISQSTLTATDGSYSFAGVVPGNYVIQETDLASYSSTADSHPPNDNQISLRAASGAVTNGNDFLDVFVGAPYTNRAPVAVDDYVSTPEDTPVSVPVLLNDSDPDNNPITLVSVVTTNGTAVVSGTNVLYTPSTNFFGTNVLTYNITDGTFTNSAFITVVVTPVNDRPVANNQNVTTPEDTVTNLVLTASDVDNTNLAFAILSGPTNGVLGTLNTNTGAVSYTPGTNYFGLDSFTFTVFDGSLYATGLVSITVTPVNDAPIAFSQSLTNAEDTALPITLTGSDVDGPSTNFVLVTLPTHGTLTGAGANQTYSPATNYFGADSFTFTVNDGSLTSAVATVSITVSPVNDRPLANNQNVTTPEDTVTNLMLTASDVDSTNLVFALLNNPTNGVLGTLNTNTGAVTYTSGTNYFGLDSFTFTVFDGSLYATGLVSITVTPVNDAPIAFSQSLTNAEDTTLPITLTGSDVDGPSTNFVLGTLPTHGGLSGSGANQVYTPATNYFGLDSFTFTVNDGSLTSAVATVSITVTAVNDAPIAFNQSLTNAEDTALPITLTSSDVDGPSTNFLLVTMPTHGALSGSGATRIYTPATNYNGLDSFTFTVNDGSLTSAVATVSLTISPVNDGPAANNQNVTTPEDAVTNLVLTASDVDSTNLLFAILSGPANGVLGTLNTNTGAVSYTPGTNYFGLDSFTFTVFDGSLYATGLVSITVTPVNDTPIAFNQSLTNAEDTALPITLTGSDVDGPSTNFVLVTLPMRGTLMGSGANQIYMPATNYFGADSFTFTVNDGSLTSAVATVSITVAPVNDTPIAFSQSLTNAEDTTLPIRLTSSDVDGPSTNFVLATLPTHGTLSGSGANQVYTPATNYFGLDSFTFTVNDGSLTSAVATVSITISAVNDAPLANNQSVTTPEDTVTNLVLTASDVDSTNLVFALLTNPTNGVLGTLNTNTGVVTYTPNINYNGLDSFTFTVFDGSLYATGLVSITMTPVNDAPIAFSQSLTNAEDTALPITLTGLDVDGPVTNFVLVSLPTHGTLTGAGANQTYTPATNYFGADSFTFTVNDGSLTSAVATVSITVSPVNDRPLAFSQSLTNAEDTVLPITLTGLDVDGPSTNFVLVTLPAHGTLTGSGANQVYAPATNYTGLDGFTFTMNDGSLTSVIATVSLTITPVNDAPIPFSQSLTNAEDTTLPITLTGSDVDGPSTNFVLVTLPTHGTLGGFGANQTYTPATNYSGLDSFTFTVNDGSLTSAVATVSITVSPVNDAPLAFSQSLTNMEDTVLPIILTGSDVDGPSTNFVLATLPAHGTLTGSGANQIYTPATNYNGLDSFTFTVNDGSLTSAVATVSITVTPVNDAPVAVNDSYSLFKNTTLNIPVAGVLTDDTDADGDSLTALLAATTTHGTVTLNSNGGFTYTPSNSYVGPDSFTYRAHDGFTNSGLATVSLTILATNTAPVAVNDSYATAEDVLLTVPVSGVLTNDTDIDGDALTATVVTAVTNGVLTLNPNGSFTYQPNTNFNGGDSFTYRANDGITNSGLATVTIAISAVNDAPLANNQNVTIPEDTVTNLVLTASDVDSTNLVFALLNNPTNGVLGTLNTNTGAVSYTPSTNYAGGDSFTFTVFDGSLYATGLVSITVTPVNDAPIAFSQSLTNAEDAVLPITLTGSDVDGPSTNFILATLPTHGTLTGSGANQIYTPATNYFGLDSFTFTVNDGSLTSAVATVSITISPVNDGPAANNQSVTMPEDTVTNLVLTASDVDSTNLVFALLTNPTNGTLGTMNTNTGAVSYTPNTNYVGGDSFMFTVFDGSLYATGLVSIMVTPVNDAPIAFSQSLTNTEDTALPITLTGLDVDGPVTNFVLVALPTHGTLTGTGANQVYTPATNYVGLDSFTFKVNDGSLTSAVATVSLTILPVNDAPLAFSQSLTNAEDTVLPITLAGSDVDGPSTNFVLFTLPTHGTLTGTGANQTYKPATNYFGLDSFTFTVNDGSLTSAVATVSITVTPVNDTPIAFSQSLTNAKNIVLPITLTGSDVDGPVTNFVLITLPAHGTLTGSGANQSYMPATNYVGADSFTFKVNDGSLTSAVATVSITMTNVSVTNVAPVANNDSYTTAQNLALVVPASGGVLTNDTDADSNPLKAILGGSPAHGTLTLSTNGGFTYTPTNSFTGTDTFTYRANDGVTNSGLATVTITVSPRADIAILKSGPTSGVAGSNLTYTITVTNLGPSTATNVLVKDLLPIGYTFVSSTPATATVVSNLVSWPAFSLANNARSNFTVTAISAEGGSFTNIAFGSTGTFDPNPTNNNGSATNSQVRTVVSPRADVAIFKVGTTNISAGAAVTYTITATNSGPSTAANVVVKDNLPGNVTFQSASGSYTLSNGVITWPAISLAKGATTSFTVVLIAPTSGSFTNIASSMSGTTDPNPTNNNGSLGSAKVRTTISPVADVIVLLTGPTNVGVGDQFNYIITLTNGGSSAAAGVVLKDNLPASLTLIAASGGGVLSNGIITWPTLGSLAYGATTNFTLTVKASGLGQFTNVAFATASTFDPNPTNNDGTTPASKVQTIVASAQFGLLAGTPVFNAQTGLFEETVIVTNIGITTVAGVRVYVGGLRSGVTLYNATGTTNGVPYVQYNSPVNPSKTVTFALEFYNSNRLAFTHTLTAVAILPPNSTVAGTNGVAITKSFMDTRERDARFVIEFTTTLGKTYTVIYSDDLVNWKVATPSVTANATVTQWYDDGPPKTDSKPSSVSSRYYRVIKN